MEANSTTKITNEMIFEELQNIRTQMEKMQTDIESLKNPVGEFTSKWVDTYDVMRMLRVSRRTMDNYIKEGKLTPTRIKKRNYFEVTQVKALMKIPDERLLSYGVDVPWLREHVRPFLEMGDD
jgi:hypothetical protein